ncbi:hypothetical protein MHZ92_09445 [Sporosarcina sp. ACRSL]|uniref:hypothetical protein n=1 Tax=Sporosarcina sp. ACRSL TaxID=2918215 RepID=UPI001EF746E0|nr:hypothetical protein [Sporosarcina sp. ACRSL]MCG7344358.1 hypothetical protein [Sporosarcina sp. ACRSL]
MQSSKIALNINSPFCKLPTKHDSKLFFIQDEWARNDITEHVFKRPNRLFFILHEQLESMPKLLGEQGTYYFHRVILSFFDAAHMLNHFASKYYKNIQESNLSFDEIQKQSLHYNIMEFNYESVDATTYLCTYYPGQDRTDNNGYITKSEVLEAWLAMNLNKILESHGISPYLSADEKEFMISDYDNLIIKMASNPELGMVMHNWRKLNNYSDVQFISTASKILEFIKADVQKNSSKFRKDSGFDKLIELLDLVSNKERKHFFGLFNEAEKLGFISRHGTSTDKKKLEEESHLFVYKSISKNNPEDIVEIRNRMFKHRILPNGAELNYLYDVWHYTTSIIVLLWFLGRKSK